MKIRRSIYWLVFCALLAGFGLTGRVRAETDCTYPVHDAFLVTLQPGDWQGVVLSNSDADKVFLVEITPTAPSIRGAYVERYVVQPEYNGRVWNDVLRMVIPADHPPLEAHVRVYDVSNLPIIDEFDTVLEPGVWHGWGYGETTQNRGYVVEITPLEPSVDGAHIERYVVQPEYDGSGWYDVLRIMLDPESPPLNVQVRVRVVTDWPVLLSQEVTAEPGAPVAVGLGAAAQNHAMVAEISPVLPATTPTIGPNVETYAIQPEFDGTQWNDVFRFVTRPEDPVTDYTVCAWMLPGVETLAIHMPVAATP